MTDDVRRLINTATERLSPCSDTARLDAQIIVAHALGKSRDWLIAHDDESLSPKIIEEVQALVQRRRDGEPVAYITGSKGFWNHEFMVTPDTLVPRPETELLVETLLSRCDNTQRSVIDLGAGSGAIAVSLAAERPAWLITATDVNPATLHIAAANGDACKVSNIRFVTSHWLDDVSGPFDIIVSNPPYIAAADPHLEALTYEPELALVSGEDGLTAIREIVSTAYRKMNEGGILLLEHGYDQATSVRSLMTANGYSSIETLVDAGGQERATLGLYEP